MVDEDKIVNDFVDETFDKFYEIVGVDSYPPKKQAMLQASLDLLNTLEDSDRIKAKASGLATIFNQIAKMEE